MKILPEEFTKSGWHHQQILRVEDSAIFKRWKEGGLEPHYEVIDIKSHNGFKIPGTDEMSEPAEYYPSDSSWGKDGFTCHTYSEAVDKLQARLLAKEEKLNKSTQITP